MTRASLGRIHLTVRLTPEFVEALELELGRRKPLTRSIVQKWAQEQLDSLARHIVDRHREELEARRLQERTELDALDALVHKNSRSGPGA